MNEKVNPQSRSEEEIAGYRDVLSTIHSSRDSIPITSSVIRQLHKDLYKFSPIDGGSWKNGDNFIQESLPSGEKKVRFRPVTAFQKPHAMDELCSYFNDTTYKNEVEPLILLGVIIAAYKEFESQVGTIDDSRGNKGGRIIEAIEHFVSDFTKSDIRKACPDVGDSTINRTLDKLKKEGVIERISAGSDTQWRKIK